MMGFNVVVLCYSNNCYGFISRMGVLFWELFVCLNYMYICIAFFTKNTSKEYM